MPTYQTIIVDITPGAKEKPVLNASQFDNGRPFNVALAWDGVPFTDAGDFDIEIHVKKPDGNIVTAEPDSVVNEVCSFLTTEQMCACHGINECEIVLLDNDIQIGTGNFILDVEKAPDEGGIEGSSNIANLSRQIDAITLAYLLNNTDEIAEIIANKIYPTLEASGDIATFNTILQLPLVSVTADPLATIITRCGINCFDEVFETGGYDSSTGEKVVSGVSTARNVTSIKVNPSTSYYFNYDNAFIGDSYSIGIYEYDENMNFIGPTFKYINNFAFTTQATTKYVNFRIYDNGITSLDQFNRCSINYPSTETAYKAYEGITKPIAEANTIKTLTGLNNVFTDAGSVTVQYKYFPDI